MDQITHNVRDAQWHEIISQCQNRSEEITVKQWLADNGIREKAYYYWLRKFRKQAYAQGHLPATGTPAVSNVTFAEVPVPCQKLTGLYKATDAAPVEVIRPVAVIRNTGLTVALTNEISESLLSCILREVSHA